MQIQILTVLMMSRRAGRRSQKNAKLAGALLFFYLTARFHVPASSPLRPSVMHPSLEHGLIGSFRPFPPSPGSSTSMGTALLCLLPSCSFPFTPCNQFSSQSPFQHLVFAPYRRAICLPWFHPTHSQPSPPPTVFMLHVFYLYPLPATVKLIALRTAPLATPQTTHAPLTVAGMRPPKITLD